MVLFFGFLFMDCIEGNILFEVIGVDFVGFFKYCVRLKKEGKVYFVLYVCSFIRGLFLEVLLNLEMNEFLRSLKWLIVCWGWLVKIYFDNGKIFVGVERWFK